MVILTRGWLPVDSPSTAFRQYHLVGYYSRIALDHLLSWLDLPASADKPNLASSRVSSPSRYVGAIRHSYLGKSIQLYKGKIPANPAV
jgi:hypothetical protein